MTENDSFPAHTGYYPAFLSMEGRICLVVGGGGVGERKIRGLLGRGAIVRLVARDMTPWLEGECRLGHIQYAGESFQTEHYEGAELVFAATSDAVMNREVARGARERRLWCNMATDPEEGSFIVPAVFQRGPLTIAVSTAGLSPALARRVRMRLEGLFGPEWEQFLCFLGKLRGLVQSKGLDTSENQRIFREVAELPLPEWMADGKRGEALREVADVCRPSIDPDELKSILDEVWKPSS